MARRDGITTQSMQSTLLQLQQLGAVERLTAPGRGRTADLQVTPSGHELLNRCRAVLSQVDRQLGESLGPGNAGRLTALTLQALEAFAPPLSGTSPPPSAN
ncbi:hypothetical protein [Kribbella antiqua]|uniref:hypothetical protein n=1 Tax=Kribbella antiqua TaxID=2512217 RepID=UPI001F5407B6|nr:hypothetical protein [Kribbella antiqua]